MGLTINTVDLWVDDLDNNNSGINQRLGLRDRNNQPLQLKQDPLALSWASYAIWIRDPARRWVDLNDVEASAHDYQMANETRKYYREKLVIDALKGTRFSEFRQCLSEVVSSDQILENRHLGIIYRLPYFYVEDRERASLFEEHNFSPIQQEQALNDVRELIAVKRIFRSRRSNEVHEYWLKDENNEPVVWEIPKQNTDYSKFVESYIRCNLGKTMKLSGRYTVKDNLYCLKYWKLFGVEMVQ